MKKYIYVFWYHFFWKKSVLFIFMWSCHTIFSPTFFCVFFEFFCVVKTHSLLVTWYKSLFKKIKYFWVYLIKWPFLTRNISITKCLKLKRKNVFNTFYTHLLRSVWILGKGPLFLEIYRFKVGISYEKFTQNYIIKTQFVNFAYFETRKFEN